MPPVRLYASASLNRSQTGKYKGSCMVFVLFINLREKEWAKKKDMRSFLILKWI